MKKSLLSLESPYLDVLRVGCHLLLMHLTELLADHRAGKDLPMCAQRLNNLALSGGSIYLVLKRLSLLHFFHKPTAQVLDFEMRPSHRALILLIIIFVRIYPLVVLKFRIFF